MFSCPEFPALLIISLLGSVGCSSSARYVEIGKGEGIVAIPANSNRWPTYYRDKALELINNKCPNGYEIVWEEEAVTGQVSNAYVHTHRRESPVLLLAGQEEEIDPREDHGFLPIDSHAHVAVPLGPVRQQAYGTTIYHDVREWRIYYRARKKKSPEFQGRSEAGEP